MEYSEHPQPAHPTQQAHSTQLNTYSKNSVKSYLYPKIKNLLDDYPEMNLHRNRHWDDIYMYIGSNNDDNYMVRITPTTKNTSADTTLIDTTQIDTIQPTLSTNTITFDMSLLKNSKIHKKICVSCEADEIIKKIARLYLYCRVKEQQVCLYLANLRENNIFGRIPIEIIEDICARYL